MITKLIHSGRETKAQAEEATEESHTCFNGNKQEEALGFFKHWTKWQWYEKEELSLCKTFSLENDYKVLFCAVRVSTEQKKYEENKHYKAAELKWSHSYKSLLHSCHGLATLCFYFYVEE